MYSFRRSSFFYHAQGALYAGRGLVEYDRHAHTAHVHVHARIYVRMCIHRHICILIHACIHAYIYFCICSLLSEKTYLRGCLYTHIHVCVHVCILLSHKNPALEVLYSLLPIRKMKVWSRKLNHHSY